MRDGRRRNGRARAGGSLRRALARCRSAARGRGGGRFGAATPTGTVVAFAHVVRCVVFAPAIPSARAAGFDLGGGGEPDRGSTASAGDGGVGLVGLFPWRSDRLHDRVESPTPRGGSQRGGSLGLRLGAGGRADGGRRLPAVGLRSWPGDDRMGGALGRGGCRRTLCVVGGGALGPGGLAGAADLVGTSGVPWSGSPRRSAGRHGRGLGRVGAIPTRTPARLTRAPAAGLWRRGATAQRLTVRLTECTTSAASLPREG